MSASDVGHQRIVIYWTLYTDTGSPLACELSRTDRGLLLVRCLDDARKVLLSECVAAAANGAEVAARWKAQLLTRRDYFERPRPAASS